MKKSLKLLVLFLCIFYHVNAQNYIYVSGSNTVNGNGSLDNPFKTINLAVTAAASGDTIVIRQGIYREQVSLGKGNINFIPYSGEQVSINGADALLAWTNVTGSVYQTVMNWNVTESDQSNQIFYKGQMLDLVRWPVNTGTRILPSNAYAENVTLVGENFVLHDADFQDPAGKWNGCDIWVNLSRSVKDYGYDGQGWTGRIISSEPGKITVQGKISGKIGDEPWGLGPNTEYFLFNPTAISVAASGGIQNYLQPGQWWKNGNTLYVRTSDNAAPSSTIDGTNLVEAKRRLYSFSFSGRSNILIKGFNTFACAINTDVSGFWNRTSSVSESSNITIDGLKAQYVTHFTNQAGQYQMQWVQRSGFILSGTNIILKNSEIQYSAGSAVSVFGRRNKILNNKIWDVNYSSSECGAMNTGRQYDPGLVTSVDHEIAYNSIYNTPQQGINIRALKNSSLAIPGIARIHHNVIHDFMLKTHDSGAIDTYDSDGNGVRIDHNIIYNATNFLAIGFYLDFGTNYYVDHNLIYNVQWPIMLNFGGWGLFTPSNMWVFNNTALASKYGKPGIANGARNPYDYSPGSNVINNITSAVIPNSAASPYVKNNFSVINATEINKCFTNPSSSDYTLNLTQSPCIDTCELAPFNDQIINKPDAGCFESGVPAWKAGYGNLKKQFLLSDANFSLKTEYQTPKEWIFPVYVLPYCGFAGDVNLSIAELPKGITAKLSSNNVSAGQSFDFTISVSDSASSGFHQIKLVGVSGELSDIRYYTIVVQQVATSLKITNPIQELLYKSSHKFVAIAYDQEGNPMRDQPKLTWKAVGGGTISSSGIFYATLLVKSVRVSVTSGNLSDTCTFVVSNALSAGEIDFDKNSVRIFPNPAGEQTFIEFESDINQDVQLSIYENSGSLVKQISLKTTHGRNKYELFTRDLKSGLYIVKLKGAKFQKTAKLVIRN